MNSPIISTNPKIMSDEIQRLKDGALCMSKEIEEILESNVKNFLPYPYYQGTDTDNGVTFTINSDGSIKLTGTATNNARCYLYGGAGNANLKTNIFGGKRLVMIGNNYPSVYIYSQTFTADYASHDNINNENNNPIITDKALCRVAIYVKKDTAFPETGTTIYPMIIDADDNVITYKPYAKTNKELTDDVRSLLCDETTAGTYKLQATVAADGSVSYEWVEVV